MDTQGAFLNTCSGAAETVFAVDLSVRSGSVFSLNIIDTEAQCFYEFS